MQNFSSLLFPYFLLLNLWLKVLFMSRKNGNGNHSFWNQVENPVKQGKGTLVPGTQAVSSAHTAVSSREHAASVFQEQRRLLLFLLSVSQA